MDSVTDESFIKELAEVHEKENFALKNRYMHQKNTMNFAEKKRMPIDESSVRELLRNQHIFRDRASRELALAPVAAAKSTEAADPSSSTASSAR